MKRQSMLSLWKTNRVGQSVIELSDYRSASLDWTVKQSADSDGLNFVHASTKSHSVVGI